MAMDTVNGHPMPVDGNINTLSGSAEIAALVTASRIFAEAINTSGGVDASTAEGALAITDSTDGALTVGLNGATNPALQIDASTASSATGLKIKSAAAAGGAAVSTISSGTNENLTIDAKGSGTITLQNAATGIVISKKAIDVRSNSATAITIGVNGYTNPAFAVDASTSSSATGVQVKSAAAAGGVAVAAISSGTDENLTIDAKGAGTLTLQNAATGIVISKKAVDVRSNSATAITIGVNGYTNPAFAVDASTGSSATGVQVKSAAAAGGVAVAVISSGTDENITIDAKGAGTLTLQNAATGIVISKKAVDVRSNSATAITIGVNGYTNPAFAVDASTGSSATGLKIKSAAAAGGAAVSTISSGDNENLTIDAKGSGTLTLQSAATGGITNTTAVTNTSTLAQNGHITMADGINILMGGPTTGTKIGTSATTQKIGFFNATPVIQPTSGDQAAVAITTVSLSGYGCSTEAQMTNIITLLNRIRTDLVALGLIKGS